MPDVICLNISKMSESSSSSSQSQSSICVKRCCVPGCNKNTRSHPLLSFFRFPVEKDRCEKWLDAIGRLDILEKGFSIKSYRVCETHFPQNSISTYINPGLPRNKQLTRVARNALPTINVNSLGKQGLKDGIKYFVERSTRRGVELSTCGVEIVDVPPDPLFKYRNLTISTTKILDNIQVCSQVNNTPSKNITEPEHIPNVRNSNTNIPVKVYSLPSKQQERSLFKRVNSSTEGRSLLKETLLKKVKCSNNVQLNLHQGQEEKKEEDNVDFCIKNNQPSFSQSNSLLRSLSPPPLRYFNSSVKNNYMNLVKQMTEKEQLDENNVGIRAENDDNYFTNTSRRLITIRPVLNNMLELSPGILKRKEVVDGVVYLFSDTDDDDSSPISDNLVKETFKNTGIEVKTEDDDELFKANADTSEQLENMRSEELVNSDIVMKSEDDNDNLSETFCIKSENIQDLLDVTNTELI